MSAYEMEHGRRGQAVFADIAERNGVDPKDEAAVLAFFSEVAPKLPESDREAIFAETMAETTSGLDVPSRHRAAMDLADRAERAKRTNPALSRALYRQAFRYERQAAIEARPEYQGDHAPGAGMPRGVLHRSAAWLALEAGEPSEAVEIAELGLAHDPPPSIELELCEVIEKAKLTEESGT